MRRRLLTLADLPALLAFLAIAWLFVQSVAGRVGYPYDLEWMEGGMLLHARRVMDGLPLYSAPSLDWIPFLYPPLYPWVVAAVSEVTGLSYEPARLISVVGVVAASLAIVRAVRVEGGSWLLGLGGAALFLSCYEDSGTFYDLVRTDGLLAGLWAWSLVSVRAGRPVLGGLLLFLAFCAKHNAAAFGLPAVLWLWWAQGRGPALRFSLASVLPALAFVGAMQWSSDGLFLTYLLEVPSHHPFVLDRFFPGSPLELWRALRWGLVLLAGAVVLAPLLRRLDADPAAERRWRQGVVYWGAQCALAVLLSMVMRGHHGGYLNVLVPAHWALSLAIALGVHALRRRWEHSLLVLLTSVTIAVQVDAGRWELDEVLPTDADRAAGDALIDRLRDAPEPLLIPHSPWYAVLAGKQPGFHLIALWDIDHGGALSPFVEELDAALTEGHWKTIVLPNSKFRPPLRDTYRQVDTVRYTGRSFYPKTGWQVRPRFIYAPK